MTGFGYPPQTTNPIPVDANGNNDTPKENCRDWIL